MTKTLAQLMRRTTTRTRKIGIQCQASGFLLLLSQLWFSIDLRRLRRTALPLEHSMRPRSLSRFPVSLHHLRCLRNHWQRKIRMSMHMIQILRNLSLRLVGSGGDTVHSTELSMPQNQRQKRAPIPLDFKHPVSTNTVPAGLFKSRSHMDMEERVRAPRPRVSSLEFSDQRSELSLDDLSVPAISHKAIRARVAAQEAADTESPPPDFNDASCPASGRSSRVSGDIETTVSESRISRHSNLPPCSPRYEAFGEGLRLEQRLEALLDRKMDLLQEALTGGIPSRDGRFIYPD